MACSKGCSNRREARQEQADEEAANEGVKYTTADGGEVPNLGEQDLTIHTSEGHHCGLKFQVADIQKPLLSVTQLTAAGNEVQFGKNGGWIVHATSGRKIWFGRKSGVYVLKVWVDQIGEAMKPGFPGPV